ncbi:hypothetical protein GGR56DRAFT_159508 [Xylariaceae sp. FL0804]|nr:hypothetical protein GGR56DRAFT_159508 [Xylariaceae sp. FL0804]
MEHLGFDPVSRFLRGLDWPVFARMVIDGLWTIIQPHSNEHPLNAYSGASWGRLCFACLLTSLILDRVVSFLRQQGGPGCIAVLFACWLAARKIQAYNRAAAGGRRLGEDPRQWKHKQVAACVGVLVAAFAAVSSQPSTRTYRRVRDVVTIDPQDLYVKDIVQAVRAHERKYGASESTPICFAAYSTSSPSSCSHNPPDCCDPEPLYTDTTSTLHSQELEACLRFLGIPIGRQERQQEQGRDQGREQSTMVFSPPRDVVASAWNAGLAKWADAAMFGDAEAESAMALVPMCAEALLNDPGAARV